MKHLSVKMDQPVELISVTPVNPLISKCQIKVCYVGDDPNRNRSVITKETAREMANSLPGCPIVGFYNEDKNDFEEHNRIIDLSNGEFRIKDTTRPYGFVDLNAKCWFAKYTDDGVEHEYLCTEGWLWTGQYPECRRILTNGNNQSMELDEKTLDATWTKDGNGKPQFFIINEAIISKLCILGEENEPCFEGSQITQVQFSFDDGFKNKLFSMMNELKELLNEGGAKVFSKYAVTIGDSLWNSLYSHIVESYADENRQGHSIYRIDGIFEDEGNKFAVLQNRTDMKYYRLNFSLSDSNEFVPEAELTEMTDYSASEDVQFAQTDVDAFEADFAKKKAEDDKEEGKKGCPAGQPCDDDSEDDDEDDSDDDDGEKKKKKGTCKQCGKPATECACGGGCGGKKKKKYNLEEVEEYVELTNKYSTLESDYNAVVAERDALKNQVSELSQFKLSAERKDKEAMIANFYMLSDEDKADVVANIDTYSLDDIEAKLSIICFRNKVSFESATDDGVKGPTTFNLDGAGEDDTTPAWVKAALDTASKLN